MKHIILLFLCGSFLLGCTNNKSAASEDLAVANANIVTLNKAQIANAGIELGKISLQSMPGLLRVNGKIDVPPQNMVSISVPLGGYLKTTSLLPGMHVRKGEVIAVMEDQQYIQLQQDYLTAKAKIGYLENEFRRQQSLNETKASSDKMLQQAEADYQSQKFLIAALAEKLKLVGINIERLNENTISRSINVYSPINGFVSAVKVNIGKYVSPTEVLFELINPSDIHLALKVFEKDISKLFIGQQLKSFTNNDPDKKHPCEIILIGMDISADRSVDVHCHFEDYDKSLIPGTYMNAEIEVKNNKAWVLPEDAVVSFGNKQYIFISKSTSEFIMTEVNTGVIQGGLVEVLNGEAFSQMNIIKKGAYSLLMSAKNKAE
jgi:cobalt-zinc-cadmium efflux system membrane fusion protein